MSKLGPWAGQPLCAAGSSAAPRRSSAARRGGVLEGHPGDAVDEPQPRHQAARPRPDCRAALELEGRRVDVAANGPTRAGAAAASAEAVVEETVATSDWKTVLRGDDLGEVGQRAAPVEALSCDLLDGLCARLRELLELLVAVQSGDLSLHLGDLLLEAGQLRLALRDGVVGEHVGGHERDRDGQQRERIVCAARACLRRGRPALARVARDQVDGLHAGTSSTASPAATASRPASMPPKAPALPSVTRPSSTLAPIC